MTDEATYYRGLPRNFSRHSAVRHTIGEYGFTERQTDAKINTNTVEGYYSIFKRGMKGIYQHCGEKHLHRYLAEFDFRYSNRVAVGVDDLARSESALRGAAGRRLTYKSGSPSKNELLSICAGDNFNCTMAAKRAECCRFGGNKIPLRGPFRRASP